jgi:hypothetical protein
VGRIRPIAASCLGVIVAACAPPAEAAQADNPGYGVGIALFLLAAYFLPWIVANHRRHHNQAALFCLNLFLGWTLIGWVVALVWALLRPPIVLVQNTTTAVPPSVELASAHAKRPDRAKSIGKAFLGLLAVIGILAAIGSLAEKTLDQGKAPTVEPRKVDSRTQQMGCTNSDVALKQVSWRRENSEFARVVGELINNCSTATGVQLQAVFRDKDGKVVMTNEFWPASTRNIAGHETYSFSTLTRVGTEAATLNVIILEAHRW